MNNEVYASIEGIGIGLMNPTNIATWDKFSNYINWAKHWLDEIQRVPSDHGNVVIFGGFQFQEKRSGDLLEIMHYICGFVETLVSTVKEVRKDKRQGEGGK